MGSVRDKDCQTISLATSHLKSVKTFREWQGLCMAYVMSKARALHGRVSVRGDEFRGAERALCGSGA